MNNIILLKSLGYAKAMRLMHMKLYIYVRLYLC